MRFDYVVEGSYRCSEGAAFDVRRRIGIRLKGDGGLEYWHGESFELSVPLLIQLVLLRRGGTFVHSAGVSIGGGAIVFPAFGGVGKTLLISHLMRQDGVKLLGDDLVIVSESGEAEAYPRPLCFYDYHRSAFEEVFGELGIRHLAPALAWRIYRRVQLESQTRFGVSLPALPKYWGIKGDYVLVSPQMVFGSEKIESKPVPIRMVVAIKRNAAISRIQVHRDVDPVSLARFSAPVTAHEWNASARFLLALSALDQASEFDYFSGTSRRTESAFMGADAHHVVELPERLESRDYFDAVTSLLR